MMINLNDTVFSLPEVVQALPKTLAFHKRHHLMISDFGTVFINLDLVKASDWLHEEIMDCSKPQDGAPMMAAPAEWRFPQLLRALGAFRSSSQAVKNGWNKDIPPGITEIIIRVNKIQGSLWIHKLTPELVSKLLNS